ncbi:hypothetical protein [Halarcobacter sp.]|uniref:hypothetical protein n=1 Tax=Halarcobacter sp. TaxID=2321133 RepID=UPI0029F57DEA|nr:hypothetical protein [Halarcobacter sp.]
MKKKKIIIFGCGNGGKNAYNYLNKNYEIIAFSDNNKSLYKNKIYNLSIINPIELENIDFDYIFIASMYNVEITEQLICELNISKDKIKNLDIKFLTNKKMNLVYASFLNILFITFLMLLVYSILEIFEYFLK